MKTVAEEIQDLRGLPVPALAARYESVFGKPPRVKHRDWLWRRLAWQLQAERLGGLSALAKERLDELIREQGLSLGNTVRGPLKQHVVPGTTLSRVWRGREVQATAVEGGWEHAGVVYRSLSAVAKAVTGAHWNGRLFFGLTKR